LESSGRFLCLSQNRTPDSHDRQPEKQHRQNEIAPQVVLAMKKIGRVLHRLVLKNKTYPFVLVCRRTARKDQEGQVKEG
jgi:hypothetical protein